MGVLTTAGHKIIIDKQTVYDSTHSFFEKTGSREAFKSDLFTNLMLVTAPTVSFREGIKILDRIRRVDGGIIETTFRNCVEREGDAIEQRMREEAAVAIEEKGLAVDTNGAVRWKETGTTVTEDDFKPNHTYIDEQEVHNAAKRLKLAEGTYNPTEYERFTGVKWRNREVRSICQRARDKNVLRLNGDGGASRRP